MYYLEAGKERAMCWVRMPRFVIFAVAVSLFVAGLYGLRQYGVLGHVEYAILAAAAVVACLALVGGLIYANYEAFPRRRGLGHQSAHFNGTCR